KTPYEEASIDAVNSLPSEPGSGGGDVVFEDIVDEHADAVGRLANRLLGYPCDVDDVVQDVFLAALKGLGKFRGKCSVKTWLFTITINTCRTRRYRRKLYVDARRFLEQQQQRSETSAVCEETFGAVRKAISRLNTKYREPIVLKYIQQLSTEEITGILGISENTLNVRLSRARKRLKGQLAELIEE
ncbi:MAG: RNA polymerase sigma factor, partial [Anaerohalosphaera sp.]|nr:RNA polymerase sigma factor [Anaerohalosphaera sp.]